MSHATRTVALSTEVTAEITVTKTISTESYTLDGDGPYRGPQQLTESYEVRLVKAGSVIARGRFGRFPMTEQGAVAAVGSLGLSEASADKVERALAEARAEAETADVAEFRAARAAARQAAEAELADLESFQRRVRGGMNSDSDFVG